MERPALRRRGSSRSIRAEHRLIQPRLLQQYHHFGRLLRLGHEAHDEAGHVKRELRGGARDEAVDGHAHEFKLAAPAAPRILDGLRHDGLHDVDGAPCERGNFKPRPASSVSAAVFSLGPGRFLVYSFSRECTNLCASTALARARVVDHLGVHVGQYLAVHVEGRARCGGQEQGADRLPEEPGVKTRRVAQPLRGRPRSRRDELRGEAAEDPGHDVGAMIGMKLPQIPPRALHEGRDERHARRTSAPSSTPREPRGWRCRARCGRASSRESAPGAPAAGAPARRRRTRTRRKSSTR